MDGACSDPRFEDDFFIDLIFAPLENSIDQEESKIDSGDMRRNVGQTDGYSGVGIGQGGEGQMGRDVDDGEDGDNIRLISLSAPPAMPSDGGLTLNPASTMEYKESSSRDNQFWEAVAARQNRCKKKRSRRYLTNAKDQFSISDEMSRSGDSDLGSFPRVSGGMVSGPGPAPGPIGKYGVFYFSCPFLSNCSIFCCIPIYIVLIILVDSN